MARTSPTCSIAGAMAMGTMYKIAWRFHSGKTKSGMASQGAFATGEKSTIPKKRESV